MAEAPASLSRRRDFSLRRILNMPRASAILTEDRCRLAQVRCTNGAARDLSVPVLHDMVRLLLLALTQVDVQNGAPLSESMGPTLQAGPDSRIP